MENHGWVVPRREPDTPGDGRRLSGLASAPSGQQGGHPLAEEGGGRVRPHEHGQLGEALAVTAEDVDALALAIADPAGELQHVTTLTGVGAV